MYLTEVKGDEKKLKELKSIARINGRLVLESPQSDEIYITVELTGDDSYQGTLEELIEWEKGYTLYQEHLSRRAW